MAQSISEAAIRGSNEVTQAQFLGYLDRYEEVDREIDDASETMRSLRKRRGDLRKTIKTAGIPLKWFDRAREDAVEPGEARSVGQTWYARMMEWQRKPVGFQPSMDLQTGDAGTAALNVHQLKEIDNEGLDAGKAGRKRDDNPYNPGSETAQRWDAAWLRGQAAIAGEMGGGEATGRRRGRRQAGSDDEAETPPGQQMPVEAPPVAAEGAEVTPLPRRRGRPPGSRNRPKEPEGDLLNGGGGAHAAAGEEPKPELEASAATEEDEAASF